MADQDQPKLTELSSKTHAGLKMNPSAALSIAAQQHLINIKVSEIGIAISNFPVFLSRASDNADWTVSTITSYEMGDNLFVKDDKWTATYMPTGMQTYPFFLMNSPQDEKNFTIGINEESSAFSKEEGEDLFDDEGKASIRLSQATAQLEADLKNEIYTYQFTKKLEDLELIKDVDLVVHYQSGKVNTLKGLNTIDETKMQALSIENLDELNKAGFLAPAYAMLFSIYQLNELIIRHNERFENDKVAQVKLEAPKEESAAA